MNIFRLAGDMTHLLSIILLLLKIKGTRSCRGVSLKTQELYALVFICRYLDLFTNFISLYNTIMKFVFLGSSFSIIYYMKYHKVVKVTYDREQDTFRYQFLVIPCLVLAMLINERFEFMEVLWTFSIYLEAVAILPQLFLLQKQGEVENLTSHYVAALGAYRALYLLNWMYRYFTEDDYQQRIVWISGIIQTALYCDFFYHYYQSKRGGLNQSVKLPV